MSEGDPASGEQTFSIFRYRAVVLLWLARVCAALAYQMTSVAVGWQVYELTSSPAQLGLVGLAQFLPGVALVLVAGQIADQYNRKTIVQLGQAGQAIAILVLAFATATGAATTTLIFATVFVIGAARSFEATTMQTIPPAIVPPQVLPRVIPLLSAATQAASIVGPALGGLLLIFGPTFAYATCAALWIAGALFVALMHLQHSPPRREPLSASVLFAGINFVRNNPIVLGAMSLDMFAVIFAGATALLPIFARDIFEVGSVGLGLMRTAPAVGALIVTFLIARWPITKHVGRAMYAGVAVFGLSTIVFGLSTNLLLSLFALTIIGASDMLSIVIRQPLIQLETPDAMRGRVSAVNSLFIGTSNQIGEFRAGMTAAWFGTIPSVLIGGIGTLIVVAIWMKAFPALYNVRTFRERYK